MAGLALLRTDDTFLKKEGEKKDNRENLPTVYMHFVLFSQ
jgi:hypothetical protein